VQHRVADFLQEKIMIDAIKRFGDVKNNHCRSASRLLLVEADSDVGDYRKECCDGVITRVEWRRKEDEERLRGGGDALGL
jgi:hypothetical protein